MQRIYYIKNLINDKIYIGQSVDIIKRFNTHKHKLRNNKHENTHLQSSFNDKSVIKNPNKLYKTFRLKYNKKKINIGRFEDFISPTIIYDLIEEALE